MPSRTRAYIGLGANVGDASRTLARAIEAVAALPGMQLRGVSRLYATRPVGVEDQPEFRNAVVAVDAPSGPTATSGAIALLVALKGVERAFGRRPRERWGPRELDLDIVLFGRRRLDVERPPEGLSLDAGIDPGPSARLLEIPHPAARERLFVLAPLADLAPGLTPPGWQETVERARRRRERIEGPDAVRAVAIWDPHRNTWIGVPLGDSHAMAAKTGGPP